MDTGGIGAVARRAILSVERSVYPHGIHHHHLVNKLKKDR